MLIMKCCWARTMGKLYHPILVKNDWTYVYDDEICLILGLTEQDFKNKLIEFGAYQLVNVKDTWAERDLYFDNEEAVNKVIEYFEPTILALNLAGVY